MSNITAALEKIAISVKILPFTYFGYDYDNLITVLRESTPFPFVISNLVSDFLYTRGLKFNTVSDTYPNDIKMFTVIQTGSNKVYEIKTNDNFVSSDNYIYIYIDNFSYNISTTVIKIKKDAFILNYEKIQEILVEKRYSSFEKIRLYKSLNFCMVKTYDIPFRENRAWKIHGVSDNYMLMNCDRCYSLVKLSDNSVISIDYILIKLGSFMKEITQVAMIDDYLCISNYVSCLSLRNDKHIVKIDNISSPFINFNSRITELVRLWDSRYIYFVDDDSHMCVLDINTNTILNLFSLVHNETLIFIETSTNMDNVMYFQLQSNEKQKYIKIPLKIHELFEAYYKGNKKYYANFKKRNNRFIRKMLKKQ